MFSKAIMYDVDEEGIATMWIDCPSSDKNFLSRGLLQRFSLVLAGLREDHDVRGLILISRKKSSFLERFDPGELQTIRQQTHAVKLSQLGQHVTSSLHNLPFPTIAAIHGTARGAGLECALACQERLASFSRQTRFSMPNIHFGLLPFLGGTWYLPRLIGLERSLDLLLSGREIGVDEALEMGLVSAVVHSNELLSRARELLLQKLRTPARSGVGQIIDTIGRIDVQATVEGVNRTMVRRWLTDGTFVGRKVASWWNKNHFSRRTIEKYQAIPLIIDAVQRSFSSTSAEGLAFEADCFGRLVTEITTRNLLFLTTLRNDYRASAEINGDSQFIQSGAHCFLIGAGLYGGAIAGLLAAANIPVRLKDVSHERLTAGLRTARSILDFKVKTGDLSSADVAAKMANISPTTEYFGVRQARFIIETLPEKLAIKTDVLQELQALIADNAIVFTTTSILPYHQLAAASGRPDRFLGLQFFPPFDRNPVVEVIRDQKTGPDTIRTGLSLMQVIGKIPFDIKNSPGYLINRMLGPYLIEAILLLEEGVPPAQLEQTMIDFGMDAGPLRILDEIGINHALSIGQILFFQLGERFRLPRSVKSLLADKRFGRSSLRGFYLYNDDGQPQSIDPKIRGLLKPFTNYHRSIPRQQIEQRLLFMLLNEASRCHAEQLVESAQKIDMAMVLGRLFPAFLGGPLRYIDSFGIQTLIKEMDRVATQYGERFEPSSVLTEYATRNMKFYQSC